MLSTSSQPSPRGVAGRLACPEHSHSRCTLAVCLTYGKQSLEQAAPPGVGTVLGLCARPGHSALPGPTKLGTPWSGRTKLWHLRSSDHYLWKTPETNPYESTCFLHFSSHLFILFYCFGSQQDPQQSPQQQPGSPRTRPGFAVMSWCGCPQAPVLPCSSFHPPVKGLWASSCKA